MRHRATAKFWDCYRRLPPQAQGVADRCFESLKRDPRHPSLHFKKVGKFWSARIGLYYRAVAIEHEGVCVWFWVGTHAEYDKLIFFK